jgi:hypothetical protein
MINIELNFIHSKGIVIESVAWDKMNRDSTMTGEILIGSSGGMIFETVIEAKDKLLVEGKERYFKPVYNMREENMPVTGLEFERFPPTPTDPQKFLVLATTPTRIYQFIGGPTFENVSATLQL